MRRNGKERGLVGRRKEEREEHKQEEKEGRRKRNG